jgi:hypothetical protein
MLLSSRTQFVRARQLRPIFGSCFVSLTWLIHNCPGSNATDVMRNDIDQTQLCEPKREFVKDANMIPSPRNIEPDVSLSRMSSNSSSTICDVNQDKAVGIQMWVGYAHNQYHLIDRCYLSGSTGERLRSLRCWWERRVSMTERAAKQIVFCKRTVVMIGHFTSVGVPRHDELQELTSSESNGTDQYPRLSTRNTIYLAGEE